ncbi:MAG: excinuclease ABC subunit UvrC [Thiotrichales bacterium]|nr:excinuclease ABC subunit UvrC [Thiotrichales bacterium]
MEQHPVRFDVQSFLRTLTNDSGVYRLHDRFGRVLYVGKARSLRKRVASYFRPSEQLTPKTRALMSHTDSVEVTVTRTETEALLLENNLIKEHRPRYNIVLRDDKSFPYIHVTTADVFPRLSFHRGPRRGPGRYFGPFASAGATRSTLSQLQKLFRIRQCEDSFFENRSRPCLQYQIERCTAPCVGLTDEAAYDEDVRHAIMFLEGKSEEMVEELVRRMESASHALEFELAARYRDQIANLRRVQARQYVSGAKGNVDVIATRAREGVAVVELFVIRNGQNLGSRTLRPAHAADVNEDELLRAFLPQHYLSRSGRERPIPDEILLSHVVPGLHVLEQAIAEQSGRKVRIRSNVRGERARWVEMAVNNAEIALQQRIASRANLHDQFEALQELLGLDNPPARIECFDVSHTGGESMVASCVVFEPDGAKKSDYRRFNIKGVRAGDDYAALRDALERRYTRLKRENAVLPDLLLIDGGRGQLKQACDMLAELQISGIVAIGIAKGVTRKPGFEQIFVPGRSAPLMPPSESAALHLIQRVRDEAHRFALTGHRSRRLRTRRDSVLEQIPGIGARRRQRVLSEFGGLQGVSRAGVEDLMRVRGISRDLALAIYEAFRDAS